MTKLTHGRSMTNAILFIGGMLATCRIWMVSILWRVLKSSSYLESKTILMLTSGTMPGDTARCRELGVDAYLTKPVRQSELLTTILSTLNITVPMDSPSLLQPNVSEA
jgi:DNA-binding NarL/FixJ family response regulator